MADATNIEWCDSTFNPWIGCTKVSPACDHCYAERSTPARTLGVVWGLHAERRRTSASNWELPRRWERAHEAFFAEHGRRRRVFCASLADVFDNQVDPAWRADLFALIAATPHLDWLLLTKRIGNVSSMMEIACTPWRIAGGEWPMPNVWLGISVVNQAEADRDIPKLLAVPAAVRFLSMEPLLGPVMLPESHGFLREEKAGEWVHLPEEMMLPIDWVIVGGESGPHARPIHPGWVRSLRDQCAAAHVPFLFKQWGEWVSVSEVECPPDRPSVHHYFDDGATVRLVGTKAAGRLLDAVQHDGYPNAAPAYSVRAGGGKAA